MKRNILIAIIVAAVTIPAGAYALSPFFTSTTIDEPLPEAMIEKDSSMMADKGDESMMETTGENGKTMTDKDTMSNADDSMTMAEKDQNVSGSFVGVGDGIHDARGTAKVISLEDGSRVLRLEDFSATNGPDLYVYLSSDKQALEFVDLGRLKANNGNQNYAIPEGADLSKYDTVLIWCKSFSVLFGSAELSAA